VPCAPRAPSPSRRAPGSKALLRSRATAPQDASRPGAGEPPLPAYVAASPDRFGELEVTVSPRQLRRTRLKRALRFSVTTGGVPLRRATIRFGDDEMTTDALGRAERNYKPERAGTRTIRATLEGYADARATLRIVAPRRR
jgi:hypothetical protein